MAEERVLVCECGASRSAPIWLRTVACVQCGRELHAPLPPPTARPSTALLVIGASASQLASAILVCLAVAWIATESEPHADIVGCGAVALAGVLAGGGAYRGHMLLLVVAAVIDAAITGMALSRAGPLAALVRVQDFVDPDHASITLAAIAGFAAAATAAALPQARRYGKWQAQQLDRALRTKRL